MNFLRKHTEHQLVIVLDSIITTSKAPGGSVVTWELLREQKHLIMKLQRTLDSTRTETFWIPRIIRYRTLEVMETVVVKESRPGNQS